MKHGRRTMQDCYVNSFYSEADRGYIADIPDLEARSAFGKTPAEALNHAGVMKQAWLAAAR
jgi:predicted RNase H-like HicB family nuclease